MFVHEQDTANDLWLVKHGIECALWIRAYDSEGEEIKVFKVLNVDGPKAGVCVIVFTKPLSGRVVVSKQEPESVEVKAAAPESESEFRFERVTNPKTKIAVTKSLEVFDMCLLDARRDVEVTANAIFPRVVCVLDYISDYFGLQKTSMSVEVYDVSPLHNLVEINTARMLSISKTLDTVTDFVLGRCSTVDETNAGLEKIPDLFHTTIRDLVCSLTRFIKASADLGYLDSDTASALLDLLDSQPKANKIDEVLDNMCDLYAITLHVVELLRNKISFWDRQPPTPMSGACCIN